MSREAGERKLGGAGASVAEVIVAQAEGAEAAGGLDGACAREACW